MDTPGMPNQRRKDFTPAKTSDPNFKSGGRSRHPNSLANLEKNKFKPGQSGNISGKSSTINEVMRLSRSYCAEAIERLVEIMRDKTTPPRDTIAACQAIMDRGMGRPIVPVFKPGTGACGFPDDMVNPYGADGELTPLLTAAGKGAAGEYKRVLQTELDRLATEEKIAKANSRAETDEAVAAMKRGARLGPEMKMLATVRSEKN